MKCASLTRSVMDNWLAKKCALQENTPLLQAVQQEQLVRFRKILGYVQQHSRFYKKHLAGVDAKTFVLHKLEDLPCTTPQDIVNWQDFVCVSQSRIERMITLQTSGTSGSPKRIAVTLTDLESTKDFFLHGMQELVSSGQRALILWPGAERPYGVSGLLCEALRSGGVETIAGNPVASLESLQADFAQNDPHVVVALPHQLASLAELLLCSPRDFASSLRGILSSGEVLPRDIASALQTHRNCMVLDHYGLTETGYGGGVECTAHSGYHMRELDLLVEILDIGTGRPLPFLHEGEVTITTLTREGMPLIRYRTGDVAHMLPGPCPCGSPMPRLSAIRGRLRFDGDDYQVIAINKGAYHVSANRPRM